MLRVSELWVYPVKSCAGISVPRAILQAHGLLGDRRYMVVDAQGSVLTARTEHRLLNVKTRFERPRDPDGGFVVNGSGQEDLFLPHSLGPGPLRFKRARIWRDEVDGVVHEAGSRWFCDYLQKDVSLLYQPVEALRAVNPALALPGDTVSLADGYPLLLCSESSLSDLNSRLETPVPIIRFRPNVVVTGADAYAEDCWASLYLGGLKFDAPKLCDRCVMTTIDPAREETSKEPLRTLSRYRHWKKAVWFGANLIPRQTGVLHVGAPVEVGQVRPHPSGS